MTITENASESEELPKKNQPEENGKEKDSKKIGKDESSKFNNVFSGTVEAVYNANEINFQNTDTPEQFAVLQEIRDILKKGFQDSARNEPDLSLKDIPSISINIEGNVSNSNLVIGDKNIVTESLGVAQADEDSFHKWFFSLDEYGKYYAVAVSFYHGLRVADFLVIPPIIKNYLLKTGEIEKKKDAPSRHPLVDTIEVKDPDKRALIIKFPLENTAGEILELVMLKYSQILFDFLLIINEVVEKNPENWELRWRSAVALGQISEIDAERVFNKVVTHWAVDDKAYVRATVGYYYYYVLNKDSSASEETRSYITGEFERWAKPNNFKDDLWKYKWTVAATCEKIGLLESEYTENLANKYLEQVAGINHVRVADSVIHALIDWSIKQKFPQAFKLLVHWAESGSAGDKNEDNPFEIRCIVALIAFSAVVEVNYDLLNNKDNKQDNIFPVDVLKSILEKQTKKENLWSGIVSIGVRYFDFKMGHYFFDMVENWAKIVPDKEFLIEFVSNWLKEIYFNLRSKTRLENRLKNVWVKSKNKTLVSIAQLTQEKIKKGI